MAAAVSVETITGVEDLEVPSLVGEEEIEAVRDTTEGVAVSEMKLEVAVAAAIETLEDIHRISSRVHGPRCTW